MITRAADNDALLLEAAVELAKHNWQVFPLRGKAPSIASPHPPGAKCRGECGREGHGVFDATSDVVKVAGWWEGRYRGCNIGTRIPATMFMFDVDDLGALARLEARHGSLPETLMTISGRAAGGRHYYFWHPGGRLRARVAPGLDVKTNSGYAVRAPSIHPVTGSRYHEVEAAVTAPPEWLIELVRAPAPSPAFRNPMGGRALPCPLRLKFNALTSWAEILVPHGWRCLSADPDGDGAIWLHPTATSNCSATVRYGCLFVYSTSTAFDVTEPQNPKGYTKFRAYKLLNGVHPPIGRLL